MNPIYTIGHSNHALDAFARLLQLHEITVVADVRSMPFSRFNPQFNRELLQRSLAELGLVYVFLGDRLGARAGDRACYVDGKARYELIARSADFQAGLQRLMQDAARQRVAMMCAEKEPLECHRTLLVARQLAIADVSVLHILEDGTLEPHAQTLARLMKELDLPEFDLFRTRDELIEEAYRRRGDALEYSEERDAQGQSAESRP